eukprot:209822-Amphidinium_carterae.1
MESLSVWMDTAAMWRWTRTTAQCLSKTVAVRTLDSELPRTVAADAGGGAVDCSTVGGPDALRIFRCM